MILKICGLKHPSNIREVSQLRPDMMGFIFYKKSPRYIEGLAATVLKEIPPSIHKVGVFVNETYDEVLRQAQKYALDAVQLHGHEPALMAYKLKQTGLTIIKAFGITDKLPENLGEYEAGVDYFLFDTQSSAYGGTGRQFDWSSLEKYSYETPYILSGGISVEDIPNLKQKPLTGRVGIDVNSKFEIAPGLKNIALLKSLTQQL